MGKKVTVIPASLNRFTEQPITESRKRKTCGYARVSTDYDEQATSYAAQMDYYKNYISSQPDMEFIGMYSDEGISATNTKHRAGFNSMVEDALAGKIDLIITKSVSRFARNTVDSLVTVRKLKDCGVEIYFEKENIWTLDAKGELLITIMSSLAQEESRSISENTTWGQRKRFADGKASMPYSVFLGYEKGPDGTPVVVPEQAKTVKLIFSLFISGMSVGGISRELEKREIPAPAGGVKWYDSTVKSILTNEKYKGDALLQKEFTVDFLTKKSKKNEGEVPQYYVEGHHEAIIPPETFDLVQMEMAERKKGKVKRSSSSIFSSRIMCGQCGGWYGAKVWHSNDKYRKVIYRCNHKFDGEKCSTPHITEDEIKEVFVEAVNQLIGSKDEITGNLTVLKDMVADVENLEAELISAYTVMTVLAEQANRMIKQNAQTAMDQNEYEKNYNNLLKQYEEKKQEHDRIKDEIDSRKDRADKIEHFIRQLASLDQAVSEFDEKLWTGLIDHLKIVDRKTVVAVFKNDVEITVKR